MSDEMILYGLFGKCDMVPARRIMAGLGMAWTISGIFWCITIIGIPIGRQCFKFTALTFFPFGKEIQYGGNAISTLANLVWLIISGIPLAITACINGILLCCTIIGIL